MEAYLHFGKAPGPFLTLKTKIRKHPSRKPTSKTGRLHTDLMVKIHDEWRRVYCQDGHFCIFAGERVKVQIVGD